MPMPFEIDWSCIDTVLLDMDGTLLDLRFDNWFWRELIPVRYAAARGISNAQAQGLLQAKFHAGAGTLNWYCIDHWTRELDLDIAQIKLDARSRIRFLPGAEAFLTTLKQRGKRRVLVTNAHPATLAIKDEQVSLSRHFDACYSTHVFALPKEDEAFWPRFIVAEPFVPQRTLFVDDSPAVLAAAQRFGIGWLRAVRRPDSSLPAQDTGGFTAIEGVVELI